jgi:hypothetical protein
MHRICPSIFIFIRAVKKARVHFVRLRGPFSTDRDVFPEALHQCIEFDGTLLSKVYRT